MQVVLPAPVGRSPTAVPGESDVRDDNVYSAGVVSYGGTNQLSMFTVPKGQTIPQIKGSAITATTNDWQTTYTDLTTNLNKAGETGSGIGDLSVRAIALNVEAASYSNAAGAMSAFGAGPVELAEIQRKTFFILKIGQKEMIKGPFLTYGSSGGMDGVSFTTLNAANAGFVRNGDGPRRLKIPILIHRSDTLEGILGVAGSTGYVFTTSSSLGNPTLIWCHLFCTVRGDAR